MNVQAAFESIRPLLDAMEGIMVCELEERTSEFGEMARQIARSPGRHLRPGLFLLSAAQVAEPAQEHVQFACVLEMIHTVSLLHDDVLDAVEEWGRASRPARREGQVHAPWRASEEADTRDSATTSLVARRARSPASGILACGELRRRARAYGPSAEPTPPRLETPA